MQGSVTLNNIEAFRAPWIIEVKRAKAIIGRCIKIHYFYILILQTESVSKQSNPSKPFFLSNSIGLPG